MSWHIVSPCMVEPVAALEADCSVRSTAHTTSIQPPPHHTTNETGHSNRLSSLLEWHKLQLSTSKMGNKKYPWPPNRKMNNKKKKTHVLVVNSIPVKRGMVDPWKWREGGHNISLIKAPIDRFCRSPQKYKNHNCHSHRLNHDGPELSCAKCRASEWIVHAAYRYKT